MVVRKKVVLAAAAALTCTGLLSAGPASAGPKAAAAEEPAKVAILTTGLDGPRQLSASSDYIYVPESDVGHVTRVAKRNGAKKLQVAGIETAQGVVRADGRFYIASGESEPEPGKAGPITGAKLLVARTGHKPTTFANLLKYELTYNPDNQTQFGPDGVPLDAVANPYYVIRSKSKGGYLLVANAGGNDIIAVSKKGRMSTFFVPPSVTTGACATQDQNSDAGPSCDAVPTGMAYGPDGNLYISAATGLVDGEGRVYVVDKNGKLLKTYTGFSGPTGVAVDDAGNVYVSELLQGAPAEESAAKASADGLSTPALKTAVRSARAASAEADAFDPSTIGQIVKVAPNGTRTYAQVTMPSGLLWNDGKLYASAWSVGIFFGIQHAGQIVAVYPSSFKAQ